MKEILTTPDNKKSTNSCTQRAQSQIGLYSPTKVSISVEIDQSKFGLADCPVLQGELHDDSITKSHYIVIIGRLKFELADNPRQQGFLADSTFSQIEISA